MQHLRISIIKGIIIYHLIFFALLNFSCTDNKTYDQESTWLLKNENLINKELDKRIIEDLTQRNADTNWIEKSIVVTHYDSTILGSFAKRINNYNECFFIEYTYSKNLQNKKTIAIITEPSDSCITLIKTPFLLIDSTKYFKIAH